MKIAMMTEGTYPHSFGGVSVWCDQLIRGMPGHDFQIVAIVATGAEQAVWSLPGNVTSMSRVPLWGPQPLPSAAGPGHRLPLRLLRSLIDTLLDSSPQAQPLFAQVLRELADYAQRWNLTAGLVSEDAVRVLSDAWQDRWPGPERTPPVLHDAITALQLLSHCLRPLSCPPARADVGHAVTNGLGVLPALAAKWRHGMPMIVTEHGVYLREQYLRNRSSPYRWPVKSFHLAFMRRLCMLGYSEAEAITPGNVYNRRWEERLGAEPSRIRTVYNGVDPANFPTIIGEPECPTISWVGRIDPIKDLETLLRSFAIVHRELPQARLRLFGTPPKGRESYLRRCRDLASELGLGEAATFEGHVENIRDAYQAGHIVALSSVSEGFPYSLIEAMTCGRACVATDVGGVAEAVGGTGLVVPPRNPARFAQACLTLLQHDELRQRLGVAARTRALDNFTVDAAISAFDEIYSFLGSGRRLPTAIAVEDADQMSRQPWPATTLTTRTPTTRTPTTGAMPTSTAATSTAATMPTSTAATSTAATSTAAAAAVAAIAVSPLRSPELDRARSWPALTATAMLAPGGEPSAVEALCKKFAPVCESAVDPLEISSALEFEGLSDQQARDNYGARDVFALAEELYQRVARRPAEPEPAADPWQLSTVRSALHGLLYGLPTACFPAAAGLLNGRGALIVLIVALLASWTVSQGLAFLGYARIGAAAPTARLLLHGMTCGTAAVALATTLATVASHARVTMLAFGAGLGGYMVGATVLMVLSAELMLLLALAPAVIGAAAFLATGRPPPMEHAAWAALAVTPVLALGLAAARTGRGAHPLGPLGLLGRHARADPAAGPGVAAAELRRALPSAGFGLIAAGLLVFPFTASSPGQSGPDGAQLASLPLALSMGAAEWTLIWFRRRTQRLLRSTREPEAFATGSRRALAAALAQYLSSVIVLSSAVLVVAFMAGLVDPHWTVLPQLAVYVALGGAMFTALLLQAFGVRAFPLLACAGGLTLEIIWRRLGVPGQIVACAELFTMLAGYAALVLADAVRHAY